MKNLQIGDNDQYGSRFNGHDLHIYLQGRGIDSKHLVWNKRTEDCNTFEIASQFPNRAACNNLAQVIESDYSLHSLLYPFSHSLLFNKYFLNADIVHLHLIHNYFFNLHLLPILTKLKPTVWTLHDPWAMTGHCVYPPDGCNRWQYACGDCPKLDAHFPLKQDTSALNHEIKRIIYNQTEVDIIVASPWMRRMVEQSPLMARFKVHLIPFGTNLDRFCIGNTEFAKTELGIPKDNIVVAFRVHHENKGVEHIRKALEKQETDAPITLLTVGNKGQMNDFRKKYQVVDMGWVKDDALMVKIYQASDIFLMPSTAEAFGMMAMEAMACGKPVVVFDGTSLPETIFAPQGGIAVPQGDVDAMKHELELLISNREKRLKLGEQARKLAEQHYNVENYISKIIDVYKEVIAKRTIDQRATFIISQLNKIAWNSPPREIIPLFQPVASQNGLSLSPGFKAKIKAKLRKVPFLLPIYHKVYKPLRKLAG